MKPFMQNELRFNTERELCAQAQWHQDGIRIEHCDLEKLGDKELQQWEFNGTGLIKNVATGKCLHASRRY